MKFFWCVWLVSIWLSAGVMSPAFAQASSSMEAAPVLRLTDKSERVPLDGFARVWIDSTAKAEFQQAGQVFDDRSMALNLPLRKENDNYALHGKAMWLHFTALNQHTAGHWRLQVGLPTTDSASLYYQRRDGSWVAQHSGDALPHKRWAMNDRYPTFVLSDEAEQPVSYLLRVTHERVPYSAQIMIVSDQDISASRQLENLILGLYFGMLLTVMTVCLVYGFAFWYPNYFRYSFYVGVLGLAQFSFLGLGTQYLTPGLTHWNSVASFVLPYAAVTTALWLVRALLQPAQFSPWLDRSLVLLCICMGTLTVIETVAPSLIGFQITNVTMLASMTFLYVLIWRSIRAGDGNARWIALGFAPVVLAALFPVLRNFGVVSTGFLSQYSVTIGSAIEVPLLMYALMLRSANQRDMRVRQQALLQQDALTGLSDERLFLSKLHSSLLRSRRYRHKLGLLHVRLQNHDHLVKEFGSQTADAAMLLTASYLRAASREIDLPARLPGHEFVLLIEGPATPARLIEASTQLIANSLRPSKALPVGTHPRLVISAALLPDDVADGIGDDAHTQYQWLRSQAAAVLDENSRKTIRSLNF